MTKIYGTMECLDCGEIVENPDMIMTCSKCKSLRMKHIPTHKILLCENENPEGHGKNGGKLSNIHKKLLNNERGKLETYHKVLKLIRSEKKQWSSVEVINSFGVGAFTDGDFIRTILDLLTCQGYLKKTFMVGKKYHLYNSNIEIISPCPYLSRKTKGKNIGLFKCKFNFKEEGKELDSWELFKQKKGDNGNKN